MNFSKPGELELVSKQRSTLFDSHCLNTEELLAGTGLRCDSIHSGIFWVASHGILDVN